MTGSTGNGETQNRLKHYYQTSAAYRDDLITHDEPFLYPYILLVKRYVQPQSRLLDLGCGTGLSTRLLLREGFRAAGVDISPLFLAVEKEAYPETPLFTANAFHLPFRNHSFDAVAAFEFIEHIPDIPALLDEIHRILKPEGWIILHSPNLISPYLPALDLLRLGLGGEGRPVFAEHLSQAWRWFRFNLILSLHKKCASNVSFTYRQPDLSGKHTGGDADSVYLSNPLDLSKYLRQKNYTIHQKAHAMSWKNRCLATLTPNFAPYLGLAAQKPGVA